MNIRSHLVVFTALCLLSACAQAEPACVFENTGHRRISGTNPKDLQCMKLLAAQGDAHWQYYLGLMFIGLVSGEKNIPEGLALLKTVARSNNKYSADAMRFLGLFYKSPDFALHDNELAYQWLYLTSQQPQFRGVSFLLPGGEELTTVTSQRMKELTQSPRISVSAAFQGIITPQRMKELEQSAPSLLRNR